MVRGKGRQGWGAAVGWKPCQGLCRAGCVLPEGRWEVNGSTDARLPALRRSLCRRCSVCVCVGGECNSELRHHWELLSPEAGLGRGAACYFCSRLSGSLAWPWPGPTADPASVSLGSSRLQGPAITALWGGDLCICWEWGKRILGASKPVAQPWSFRAAWPAAQGEAHPPRDHRGPLGL